MAQPLQVFSQRVLPAGEPEQLQLYGPSDGGLDMAKLRAKVVEMGARRSVSTARAYACDWRDFEAWCKVAGRCPLPAGPETLALYVAHGLETGRKCSSLERRLAAIASAHRAARVDVPSSLEARGVLNGALRAGAAGPKGKAALSVADLRKCVAGVSKKSALGLRDRAILVLGFASALRRSELVGLDMSDVLVTDRGVRVFIRRSKTDQVGAGREIGIFPGRRADTCPLRVLRAYLKVRGDEPGPLFLSSDSQGRLRPGRRLLGHNLRMAVLRAVEGAGLDVKLYGAHSLRAGCITAAAEAGVPESIIMQRSGHKSIAMVARYVRPASIWSVDPLARAL